MKKTVRMQSVLVRLMRQHGWRYAATQYVASGETHYKLWRGDKRLVLVAKHDENGVGWYQSGTVKKAF